MKQEQIIHIPIDAIRISPFQPRREFAAEDLKELADSIESVGLIHPPVVRAVTNQQQILYYELIAGERRWRACQLLNQPQIPVIVREYDDATAAQSTLIENLQRVDLDPIEMAHAFKRLIEIFRMTQEDVALKVGKKRSTIANYLRLLTLPEETQQAISQGRLSMGHAKAILAVENPDQQELLKKRISQENMTVREAEQASRLMQSSAPVAEVQALEHQLADHLRARVCVDHLTNGSGKIIIYYQNLDDLDQILEKIQLTISS